MKTKLRFISLLMAIVMCLSLFAACGSDENDDSGKKDDKEKVTETNTDKVEEVEEIDPEKEPMKAIGAALAEIVATYSDVLEAPAAVLEKAAENTATYGVKVNLDGIEADLNAVVDPKTAETYAKLNADIFGTSAEAEFWLGEDIAVKAPDILGNEAYGLNIGTLKSDFEASPLLEMMGMTLDELYDSFESETGMSIDEFFEIFETMGDTVVVDEEIEAFLSDLSKVAEDIETDVSTVEYDGKDAYMITLTVTEKEVQDFVVAMVDFMEDVYGELVTAMGQDFDDMRDEILDGMDEMEEAEVSVDVYLDKDSGSFMLAEAENDGVKVSFEVSGDEANTYNKTFVLRNTESSDEYTSTYEVVVEIEEVSEKGKSGFEISVTTNDEYDDVEDDYDYDDSASTVISFVKETADGDFELKYADDYDEYLVKGNYKCDDKKVVFGITSVEVYDTEMEMDVSVSVELGGKVEKCPKYTNIFKMSENDWTELVEIIGESELVGMLGGSSYESDTAMVY